MYIFIYYRYDLCYILCPPHAVPILLSNFFFIPPVQTVVALRGLGLKLIKHLPQVRGSKCVAAHLPPINLHGTTTS